jgi:hypothetical protein
VEVHAAVGGIDAFLFEEAEGAFGPGEPVGFFLVFEVEGEEHPAHAALGPDGFVGVDQGAIAIEAMEEATVGFIDGAWEPEGDAVVEEVVVEEHGGGRLSFQR